MILAYFLSAVFEKDKKKKTSPKVNSMRPATLDDVNIYPWLPQ